MTASIARAWSSVGELRLEPLQPLVLEVVRRARCLLPLRIERDQLGGELAHRLAGARLQVLPGFAAELGERGRAGVGADVLRDLAQLLVRHVETVLAAEREEEIVARDARDLLRLEADQLADAVVLVDDEVAAAEVGERRQRTAEPSVGTRWALAEDLRVRQQDEAELAPDEASAGRRDGEEKLRLLRKVLPRGDDARVGALEQVLGAQRLARVGERDHDTVAAPDEAVQLVLRLREPAGGDRGPLGLERERLRLRERIELRRARERDLGQALLSPDAPYLVRLPDEVRRAVEYADEVVRDRRRRRLQRFVIDERRLAQVGLALGRRIDDGVVDGVQRPLGERREGSHLLDLVAVELDAERLAAGRREDVDNAAANGELAALLGTLDPFVAGQRERLREAVEPGLVAYPKTNARRALRCGRRPLRERRRRGADEPALREHVEGAGSLANEVRRRLEAGAPAHAATRQQCDAVGADEPTRSVGRVAGVRVLGQQADESPVEVLVQRREE